MSEEKHIDCKCVQCDWEGTIDEAYFETEAGELYVCPICHSPVEMI